MEVMQEMEKKTVKKAKDVMVYEVGYLLVPTLSEDEVPGIYGNLKELIASFGGEVTSDEMPRMINLAYTMAKVVSNVRSKYDAAYFGWIKFDMDTQKLLEFKKKLDLDSNVLRFLIIKTVKENNVATRKSTFGTLAKKKAPSAKKEGENEEVAPIDKVEIDKEIDAMVVSS